MKGSDREFIKTNIGKKRKGYTVPIDETGSADLGEGIMIMTATILPDAEISRFEGISEDKRTELGVSELKYNKATKKQKEEVSKNIAAIDHSVIGVYIDKAAEDNPIWWYKHRTHRGVQHLFMLEELSEDLMKEDIDDLTVVIDEHSGYRGRAESALLNAARDAGKTICYAAEESSEDGPHRNLLQTNDFKAGEIGRTLRKNERLDDRAKMRRLTKHNTGEK